MTITLDDLVVSTAERGPSRLFSANPDLIRIRRGAYLPSSKVPAHAQPWDNARAITQARAVSLSLFKNPESPPILTAEAALAVHDLTSWLNTTDIEYRRSDSPRRGTAAHLPAITCGKMTIAQVKERRIHSSPITSDTTEIAGVLTAPLWAVGVDSARMLHPIAGTVAMSSVLSKLTKFDMHRQNQPRENERKLRAEILCHIDSMPPFPGSRRMRRIVEIADAGMDTPGEGYLLWLLHCIINDAQNGYGPLGGRGGATRIFTQFEIIANGRRYFADIAVPQHRVIIEFDGSEKVSGQRAQRRFLERQGDLHADGWRVIRVSSAQLDDPLALAERLKDQLRSYGVPVKPPSGLLWKMVPSDLLGHERRH
ncbi:MAG: DUF559 domain-containing protein [Ancrocorticia sp.]|uniref:DUF559 domain-containing protein n=1 Tax=Ancrocorticia sp. TaxID=2593684 RepID=UPI003F936BC3